MVLVDTSVLVDHFRKTNPHLATLLTHGQVTCHPFVIGELACGNLRNRREILSLLQALPSARVPEPDEVLFFIERQWLMGLGIGIIDIYLLASIRRAMSRCGRWTSASMLSPDDSRHGICSAPR